MPITEVVNKHYDKIKPIRMSNDSKIEGIHPPLPNSYNFFMLLIGKPGSGKSTFWLNLLMKNKRKDNYYKKFDSVYIFSKSLNTITTKIHLDEDHIFNSLDGLEDLIEDIKETDDKTLIIIDDCVADIKDVDWFMRLIFNRRHIGGGISLIITSQVYNRIQLAVRKCASDLILFNTANKKELNAIFEEYCNVSKEDFNAIIKHSFAGSSHDFVVIKTETGQFYHNFNLLKLTLG